MANFVLPTMLMTTLIIPAAAVDRYVSTDGSDANDGGINSSFLTLQACVDVAETGDACYLRGGTYQEEVSTQGKRDFVIARYCSASGCEAVNVKTPAPTKAPTAAPTAACSTFTSSNQCPLGSCAWTSSGCEAFIDIKVSFKELGEVGYLDGKGAPYGVHGAHEFGWTCDGEPIDQAAGVRWWGNHFDRYDRCKKNESNPKSQGITDWRVKVPNGSYQIKALFHWKKDGCEVNGQSIDGAGDYLNHFVVSNGMITISGDYHADSRCTAIEKAEFIQVPNTPASGGNCGDPDPNTAGVIDYLCPNGHVAKTNDVTSAACTNVTECTTSCCEAACSTLALSDCNPRSDCLWTGSACTVAPTTDAPTTDSPTPAPSTAITGWSHVDNATAAWQIYVDESPKAHSLSLRSWALTFYWDRGS